MYASGSSPPASEICLASVAAPESYPVVSKSMSTSNLSSSSRVNELVLRSIWPPCSPKMVMTF